MICKMKNGEIMIKEIKSIIPKKLKYHIKAKLLGKELNARHYLKILEDDVFLASYPRSGNTWMRFLLGTLIFELKIDWRNIEKYFPDIYKHTNSKLLKQDRPRYLKWHHPYDKRINKAIYLVRDVRDVVISFYHFKKRKGQVNYSFDIFINKFLNGKIGDYGTWKYNVNTWLSNAKKIKNKILIIKYEDLKINTENEVEKILDFINIDRSRSEIRNAITWTSIDNMKKLEKDQSDEVEYLNNKNNCNKYIRKGKTKDWKNVLSRRHIKKINDNCGKLLYELGYKR